MISHVSTSFVTTNISTKGSFRIFFFWFFSSFFGGEGFVTRMEGKGKIIIQTRSLSGLADWINPRLW